MSHMQIGTVRERLWLLGHDERHGLEPRMHPRALEIGLMAATLVDLLIADRIGIAPDGQVFRAFDTSRRAMPVPLDPITAGVLEAITAQAMRLTDMLRAASADLPDSDHHPFVRLYHRTHAALIAAGIVVEQRRTFRTSRYRLADSDGLAWNKGQVSQRLVHHDRPGDTAIDSLCALVGALNLHTMLVTPYEPYEAGQILRVITQRIPERVGPGSPLIVVPRLAHCVRTAVGDLATAVF